MNEIQERFNQPRLRLIKSPWEAALEGSVEAAFQEVNTPRGVVMAPTPTTLRKLATPSPSPLPPTPQPREELYKPKPPKAWNPQPTCKSFSSVKLDKIFAGSPKSPVSIAYHPETNTISSEPVVVEHIPPIATQLAGHEVFDQSVLREPKLRRPDEFLIYDSIDQNRNMYGEHGESNLQRDSERTENNFSQSETYNDNYKASETANLGAPKNTFQNGGQNGYRHEERSAGNVFESSSESYSAQEQFEEMVKQSSQEISHFETQEKFNSLTESVLEKSKNVSQVESSMFTRTQGEVIQQKSFLGMRDSADMTKSADEEVEDLCEREFNELSLEYEKVEKKETAKSPSNVPGAKLIFDPQVRMPEKQEEPKPVQQPREPPEVKKPYKKPPSMVPGARPLFGGAVDIQLTKLIENGRDEPYEKIPVRNLIDTFEQSTRPVMKYKQMQDLMPANMQSPTPKEEKAQEQPPVKPEEPTYSNPATMATVEEVERHYEIQQHKKEVYDQQMQQYKEQMKMLQRRKSGTLESSNTEMKSSFETRSYEREEIKGFPPLKPEEPRLPLDLPMMPSMPAAPSQTAPPPAVSVPFNTYNNFNTAPRGWQSTMSYYRPITFNANTDVAYTDF